MNQIQMKVNKLLIAIVRKKTFTELININYYRKK